MARASRKLARTLHELVRSPDATDREATEAVEREYPLELTKALGGAPDDVGQHRARIARSRGLLVERVEALAVRIATDLGDHMLAAELAEVVRMRHLSRAERPPAPTPVRRPRAASAIVTPAQIATDVERVLGPDPHDRGSS